MQIALCSFLSLTGPSPWPQAVIKAVISSYSLKERAGPCEGFTEGWSVRVRAGGREGGRQTKEEGGMGHFLPNEVMSSETTFLKKTPRPMQCFYNCYFPEVWLRQRGKICGQNPL